MIRLEVADLIVIAGRVLGLDTAGVLDLLDPAAAERSLARVRPDYGPDNLSQPAADLLCALVRERPLERGNQQVALAAALQFLALNGQEVDFGPAGTVAAVVSGVAANAMDPWTVGVWLATQMRPASRPAASAKEEAMRARPALPFPARIRKVAVRSRSGSTFGRFTLLRVERGIAAWVLTRLGAGYDRVRDRVAELTNQRQQADQEAQEARRPTRAELADVAQQLDRVRMQKEEALGAEEWDAALALRDREKELVATKTRLERQLQAAPQSPDMLAIVLAENQRLHRELDRLRRLLRDRGIKPEGGTAWPA